jgi:nucleolar protein 12
MSIHAKSHYGKHTNNTQAGPVQAPPKSRYQDRIQKQQKETANDEELSELSDAGDDSEDDSEAASEEDDDEDDAEGGADSDEADEDSDAEQSSEEEAVLAQEKPAKKRKRGDKEEVEDTYMRKLAIEEEKEEEQRQKKRKTEKKKAQEDDDSSDESEAAEPTFEVPKHESLAQTEGEDTGEIEKAARTVFLSNVSTDCIESKSSEKALKKHLESFIADLADNNPPHKVESIRYRSTAFDNSLPKRAAFAKKEIKESTTRSTNAYAVYTTTTAAREAVKRLNGTVFLKRHLHVDSVAHPTKIDHRRCVFVGNLPFVDDESQTPTKDGEEPKKKRPASDIEEGLWTHFAKAGKIESVRVVRDAKTRVGKGFAYVQFVDENGVEAALQFNEQKYPPMLPRKLRVTRCKAEKKKKDLPRRAQPGTAANRTALGVKGGYQVKLTDEQKSAQGRALNMLGKVAKAQGKEGFVFEGHRAKEGQGKSGLKFKGSGGKKKGVNGRKSRSTAWKSKGKK